VAAPSKECREATEAGAAGVVRPARQLLLSCRATPLLCEEGNALPYVTGITNRRRVRVTGLSESCDPHPGRISNSHYIDTILDALL